MRENERISTLGAVIFFSALFSPGVSFSAPQVQSVSGPLVHGAAITVQGAGFGIKNPPQPLVWADFENGSTNPSSLGQRTAWDGQNNGETFAVSTANQPHANSSFNVVAELKAG